MAANIGNRGSRLIQDAHCFDLQYLQVQTVMVNNMGYRFFIPYCVQLFTMKAVPFLGQQQTIDVF
jgi:hypothetical protein